MREAILQWAATLYAENPPQTLKALLMRLQDPIIEEQFNQLDRHLYRPNEVNPDKLNLSPLLEALAKHSTFSGKEKSRASNGRSLKELYPY